MAPTHAIIAVSDRFNARCLMCDIQRKLPREAPTPRRYFGLPRTLREVKLAIRKVSGRR